MTDDEKINHLGDSIIEVLQTRCPTELVSLFHAAIMANRNEPNPSKEDFEKGRTIAYGAAIGFMFARKNQDVSESEIVALVKKNQFSKSN